LNFFFLAESNEKLLKMLFPRRPVINAQARIPMLPGLEISRFFQRSLKKEEALA